MFNTNKSLHVSHVDLDGITPFIIDNLFGLTFNYNQTSNYDEEREYDTLVKEDLLTVVYTDFTPSERCRKIIEEKNLDCIIFDHHESITKEIVDWNYPKKIYIYDVNKCGSRIYYEYLKEQNPSFKNDVMDTIITRVDNYDMWRKDSLTTKEWEDAQDLNRLMFTTCNWSKKLEPTGVEMFRFFIDGMFYKCNNYDTFFYNKFESQKIIGDKNKEKELFLEIINSGNKKMKTRKDNEGHYFVVIKLRSKVSAICSLLLEKYSKVDYIICINEFDPSNKRISFRSRELNVLEFEGVEGHELAGGVSNCTNEMCDKLWEGTELYCFSKKLVD